MRHLSHEFIGGRDPPAHRDTQIVAGYVVPEDGTVIQIHRIAVILPASDTYHLFSGLKFPSAKGIIEIDPVGGIEKRCVAVGFVEPLTPGICETGYYFAVDTEHEIFPFESCVGVVGAVLLPKMLIVHAHVNTKSQQFV